jgi:hypothetical protein
MKNDLASPYLFRLDSLFLMAPSSPATSSKLTSSESVLFSGVETMIFDKD